jgi:fimbrial isopeptide formation D2 family protein
LGTTVIDSAWIEPMTGDCNLANNSAIYRDTCVGSYDPNDKTAYPAGNTDTSVKVIDYLIRFQNTGTAPAHNVVIVDSLENNLDFNTLTLHSTSHKPCRVFTNDNKKVYFEFENIMLPDSGTDYEGSQGYVNFSVKLKENLAVGTQIKNTAAIYFDFNDPIITNTTVNTIYLKSSSGIISKEKDYTLELYPNPTKGEKVTLKVTSDKMQTISYRIFDLNGREKKTTIERKANGYYEEEIQLNSLSKGIYLIDISINGEASGKIKLVKD